MKSRNLKAIFAALSAVAVMATAMTGFAAATTTYDLANNKVIVEETVTAEAGKEVTYLVKSNNQIVYIDQTTADASTGKATFSYKIASGKIVNLETAVTYGTDGTKVIEDGNAKLDLYEYADVDAETYTIDYDKAISGNADKAVATITAKKDYEIESITIGGVAQTAPFAKSYEVANGAKVEVTTKLAYVAPTISAESTEPTKETVEGVTYDALTTIIAATGDYESVGVNCKGIYYPALKVNEDGKAAVKLILPGGSDLQNVKIEAAIKYKN